MYEVKINEYENKLALMSQEVERYSMMMKSNLLFKTKN